MIGPGLRGIGWRVSRQKAWILSGMSPGVRNRGSAGLISESKGGAEPARCVSKLSSISRSFSFQKRRHSSRIQRPTVCLEKCIAPP